MWRKPVLLLTFASSCVTVSCTRSKEETPSGPSSPAVTAPSVGSPAGEQPLDAAGIGERLGTTLTALKDGTLRATLPRDLSVTIGGDPAPRASDLGTSLELRAIAGGASLAGQVALLEDEISPVLDTLLAHGIIVVGLHNRFAFDEPRVLLLHFSGEGNPFLLASGVQSIGSAIRDARLRSPKPLTGWPGSAPTPGTLDAASLGGALGGTASARGGEVVLSVPWPEDAPGMPRELLSAAWTGSDVHAAVEGTLRLTFAELAPALGALRRGNLHLTALHPDPATRAQLQARAPSPIHTSLFRAYFYGKGSSLDLARALRGVLEARRASAPSSTSQAN